MKRFLPAVALLFAASGAHAACNPKAADAKAAGPGCARAWMDANLHLNDIAVLGTHNSYHQRMPTNELELLRKFSPEAAITLDYNHVSLTTELDHGVRELEIDVVYDPEGGRYLHPVIVAVAGDTLEPERLAALAKPGFKVIHVPDVDVRSNCLTLTACLKEVRAWSDAHPDHVPILIIMNTEDGKNAVPGGTPLLPFDAKAYADLDAEVRAALGSKLLTPDEVRGSHATLREAVLAGGWPTLGQSRGRILMAIDEPPQKVNIYMGDKTSLQGKALFVNSVEDWPSAAYLTLNDPVGEKARIAAAVKAGFLVRTRADADTHEARENSTTHRDVAMAGGAQSVSTDYLKPDPNIGTPYFVPLRDGAAAICDPLRRPERCAGLPVEAAPTP
jgi:Phosphoinositide phospholipase C, Ca2+-dependent